MVNEITRCGLIISQAGESTALLDELIAICDWPVVYQPSARLLFQQIEISRPLCLLFWLDAGCDILPSARLISRLRDRGPRPYRIAVAHRLEEKVEHIFRSAGVHSFFATSGNMVALVEDTLLPFVDHELGLKPPVRASIRETALPMRGPADVRGSPASMRPP